MDIEGSEEPEKSPKVHIVERVDEDKAYRYSFTYEKATHYEFKYVRSPVPDPKDPCYRCNRRVSVKDQVWTKHRQLFHKQCFRCRICGLPLTHKTYLRSDNNGDMEIYCRTHIGKSISEIQRGEVPGMDEKANIKVDHDDKKYIFSVVGSNVGNSSTPLASSPHKTSSESKASPVPFPRQSQPLSPSLTNVTNTSFNDTSIWDHQSFNASFDGTPRSPPPAISHDRTMNNFTHPRPVLSSFHDFDNAGVFDAERLLEQRHDDEKQRLSRFLAEECQKELHYLDDAINEEKEKAAEELLANFNRLSLHNRVPHSLVNERERIERHFRAVREDRERAMSQKMLSEERIRCSKMADRHCQEMLLLISEKDRMSNSTHLYDRSVRPPVEPAETKKLALYSSPAIFEHIDLAALKVAEKSVSSHTELVRELTDGCDTELHKLRSIFRWMVAIQLSQRQVSDVSEDDYLLRDVHSGKETYHELLKTLCSFAGLHCEIISGYSKGTGYKPAVKPTGGDFRNTWTAVFVGGSWRLVNVTWAARRVSGRPPCLPSCFSEYDEFYFLTDPDDYIYQHYPDKHCWQLLDIPLPFSEFLSLPVVKSPFFNHGLKFHSNYGATISSQTGMLEVRAIAPDILGFSTLLEPVLKSPSEPHHYAGRVLIRYVRSEVIFTVALPGPGLFYFTMYVGDYWKSDYLESACSFLLSCPCMSNAPSPPYPPVPFFGHTPVMRNLGIRSDCGDDPMIVCKSDFVTLSFQLSMDVNTYHTFQLFDRHDESISDIDQQVFLRSRTTGSAVYLARCPKEGFYIFSLYASESRNAQTGGSGDLECAVRYLVICKEPSPTTSRFPRTCLRWQNCSLHEPLSGDLIVDTCYLFRLSVPLALEVFVVTDDVYHSLKSKIGNAWEGQVRMGSVSSVLCVKARYPVGKERSVFTDLLEYTVMDDVETEI